MTTCQECDAPTDNANLCADDVWKLAQALGDIPGLLSDLRGVVARQARMHRTIGAPREPDPDWRGGEYALIRTPWAMDTDAAAELDRIGNELVGWVRHLCESRGLEPPVAPRGVYQPVWRLMAERNRIDWRHIGRVFVPSPEQPVAILARWLLAHTESIRLDEAAGEILAEIVQLRADLMRAVDNSPSPFYAGPCHAVTDVPSVTVRGGTVYVATVRRRCELDLYAWVNPWATDREDAKIVCRGRRSQEDGCGTVHTVLDRQDWLLDSMEDALLTIDDVTAALPKMLPTYPRPPRTVIQSWVRQGRLVAKSVTAGGLERFRGGDMLDLIQAYRPRVFAPRPGRRMAG